MKMDLGINQIIHEPGTLSAPLGFLEDMQSLSRSWWKRQPGSLSQSEERALRNRVYDMYNIAHPFTGIHVTEKGLDMLEQYAEEDDVAVVDMFDKVYKGTFVGGNLSTAISARTKRGGAVIWGGIRDNQQVVKIEGINVYYRGSDPTAIEDVTMVGMNVPCRIGRAVCLPGDVVLGTPSGVIFIPPHLAETTVELAEKSQVRDVFGFIRLNEGIYTTAQIDVM